MAINPMNSDRISPKEISTDTTRALGKNHMSRSTSSSPTSPTDTVDPVNLSDERKEYQALLDAIKRVSDIRQEKVKQIQHVLEAGKYRVPSEDIADRIIQDTIMNRPRSQS